MKRSLILPVIALLLAYCTPPADEKSLPLQVADAYGFQNLENIAEISYTWNVRRDSVTVVSRDWRWNRVKGEVHYAGPDTTVTYLLAEKTPELDAIDQRFINDKYWLMFPFQLAWDSGYRYEVAENLSSPIQKIPATKLSIIYNDSDGYTPGDAYDLYLNDDLQIVEWVFRRGNGPEGRAVTWDNIQNFEGIMLTLDHKNDAGMQSLWFTNVKVVPK
ncbi:hypothetical protein ADIS_3295 [Lunatimonas lonarensis]|uniref:Uncharacterized protein n=1 Tax=Lunatimonas lonarensis TaxID=1232681 RepID=R7ZQ01_9BACT|nr:hypothetical protein [Lunatimonas lonarensis]EON76167.1 hypothetical protein ADIS_3295 [Lunatimonas lonarensis]